MPADLATAPFAGWDNFYLIVGSAAGALTGLQFVVMALIADLRPKSGVNELGAFGTPNVVHFCAALLVSAIAAAPWHRLSSAGAAIGACGAVGVAYSIVVTNRAMHATLYRPVFEDWLWHTILPLIVYADLLVSSIWMQAAPEPALFAVAAGVILLLFIGIHNAWDTVTYIAMTYAQREDPSRPSATPVATPTATSTATPAATSEPSSAAPLTPRVESGGDAGAERDTRKHDERTAPPA